MLVEHPLSCTIYEKMNLFIFFLTGALTFSTRWASSISIISVFKKGINRGYTIHHKSVSDRCFEAEDIKPIAPNYNMY